MGSVHEVIEAFRTAPSNSERGTTFKKLMVRYFELDPTISQQYDAVWRWIDWPERQGKTDSGIDLNRCRMADVEYAWAITASVNWRRSDHSAPREMVSARGWNFDIPDRLGLRVGGKRTRRIRQHEPDRLRAEHQQCVPTGDTYPQRPIPVAALQ